MKPGGALVSSISVARMGELPWLSRPSDRSLGPVVNVSILTRLAEPVPADAYPEAVDLAFGGHAKYGQIVKDYRNATMSYTPSEMVTSGRGSSAYGRMVRALDMHVPCRGHNLTIRTLMKRFTRLGLGFEKKRRTTRRPRDVPGVLQVLWRTRLPGKSGRYRLPAAMAAGVANRLWSFERLYDVVMGENTANAS